MRRFFCLALSVLAVCSLLSACTDDDPTAEPEKPVIYLYPETETEVTVQLDFDGELTCTYPAYDNGWTVTARRHLDGRGRPDLQLPLLGGRF